VVTDTRLGVPRVQVSVLKDNVEVKVGGRGSEKGWMNDFWSCAEFLKRWNKTAAVAGTGTGTGAGVGYEC
jgi:hypothetical protein